MTRRGRVLVIDDEPLITRVVGRILAGHDVRGFNDATSAVEAIRDGARFDVILCDLAMPDLSGVEVHHAVTEIAPEQARRFVFMTGGAYDGRTRQALGGLDHPRVDKPFDAAALRALVDRMVEDAGGALAGGDPVS